MLNTCTLAIFSQETLSRFQESLVLMIVGMAVVFCTLAVIGEGIGLLTKLVNRLESPPSGATTNDKTPSPSIVPPAATDLDPQILVIIAAAAYMVLKKPVRIRAIKRINHKRTATSAWVSAGRQHIQSHDINH